MSSRILVDEIYGKTANTSALTIDSSGRVTTPARPSFHVQRTAGSGTGSSGVLTFNVELHDIGGCWNSNYFEAPVSGVYHFSFVAFGSNSSGGNAAGTTEAQFEVSTDGGSNWTEKVRGYTYADSSDHQQVGINVTFQMEANDRVRINVANGYIYTNPNGYYINFSGHLVG